MWTLLKIIHSFVIDSVDILFKQISQRISDNEWTVNENWQATPKTSPTIKYTQYKDGLITPVINHG